VLPIFGHHDANITCDDILQGLSHSASEAIRHGLAPSCLTFQLSLLLQNGNFEAALDPTARQKESPCCMSQ